MIMPFVLNKCMVRRVPWRALAWRRHLTGRGYRETAVLSRLEELTAAFNLMQRPDQRLSNYLTFFGSDAVIHGLSSETRSVDALEGYLRALWLAFPDLEQTVDARISAWSFGATRWRAQGSHRSSYLGEPPTMRPVVLNAETIMRFNENGLIEEMWINVQPIETR